MAEQYLAEPMVEEAYQDLARTILEHNPGVHLDRVAEHCPAVTIYIKKRGE